MFSSRFSEVARSALIAVAVVIATVSLTACGSGGGGGSDGGTTTTPAGVTVTSITLTGHVAMPVGAAVTVKVDDHIVTPADNGTWTATVPYNGTARSVTLIKRVNGAAVSTRTIALSAP